MRYTILIDFGSTFTKVTVACLESKELIYTTLSPSTVNTDASIALDICLDKVKAFIGEKAYNDSTKLACSSAAGGLKMVVIGLTPSYSEKAGVNVSAGAGSKVVKSYSFGITDQDIEEIESISPDIILLCGGIDDGNTNLILHNANKLADSSIVSPIVYAGNSSIVKEVRKIFLFRKKECIIAENIFPSLEELNVESASNAIRNIFMEKIIHMKGLSKVVKTVGEILMPTPASVLAAGNLLSRGVDGEGGESFEDMMIVDIGGATTDVYSFSDSKNKVGVKEIGSREPYAKRTVEGDLGLRISAQSLMMKAEKESMLDKLNTSINQNEWLDSIEKRTKHPEFIPNDKKEEEIDFTLSQTATKIASRRHAGRIFKDYEDGWIRRGKDLREIKYVIGTGGPIINSNNPKSILEGVFPSKTEPEILLPTNATFYLDNKYILYAIGLLSTIDKECAYEIMKKNLEIL